jgi:hypothetical protein
MAEIHEWVSFQVLRASTGKSPYKVRQAIAALRLQPRLAPADQRRIVYDPDWAKPIQIWIETGKVTV